MTKVCPLYKQDFRKVYADTISCDRDNCALWVPAKINPEKYGHCGLRS